jgi:hypothetical protein
MSNDGFRVVIDRKGRYFYRNMTLAGDRSLANNDLVALRTRLLRKLQAYRLMCDVVAQ